MGTVSSALAQTHVQTELKLYIKNTSAVYVDFTARFGEDRLLGSGKIIHQAEGKYGQPITQTVTISVDNSDRYWDQDAPAAFDPWEGRYVQIRLNVAGASEQTLGTFRIAPDGIETDDGADASIKLEPLTETLQRSDASSVKHGSDKHQDKSWLFLAEELIRPDFGDASGDLPATYELPTSPVFTFPDGNKHFSTIGKPPGWDGTSWNSDNIETPYAIDGVYATRYYGIGDDLWIYDLTTELWTNKGEHATNGNGVPVKAVYQFNTGVVVLKWEDSATSVYATTLYVNVWDITAGAWHATTVGNYTDFFSGTWHIFNGDWNAALNRQLKGMWNWSGYNREGTNIPIPFEQKLTADFGTNNSIEYAWAPGLAIDTGSTATWAPFTSTNGGGKQIRGGGWITLRGEDGISANFKCRVAWGNKPNIAFDRVDSAIDGYIYFVSYDSGTNKMNVKQLTIDKGSAITSTTLGDPSTSIAGDLFFSLTLGADKTNLLMIQHRESKDATGYDLGWLVELAISTPPNYFQSTLGNSHINNESFMIDIAYYDESSNDAWLVFLEADRMGKWPMYSLISCDLSDNSGITYDRSVSYYNVCRKHCGTFPTLVADTAGGTWKIISDFTSAPALIDNGLPPVFNSPYCPDFSYSAGADPDIFGISWPYHNPETQDIAPDGKNSTWQYVTVHAGRVELADFDGMNKLEALSKLCEAYHHSVFVAPDGDFIITPTAPSGTPSDTIGKYGFSNGWLSIKRKQSTDIINYIEYVPYVSSLKQMDTTLVQKESSPYNGNVSATQLDTKERNVKLRCILGGYISEPTTKADIRFGPRFDFLTYSMDIATLLGSTYSSGTSVIVESTWDIEVGDFIQVVDSEIRTITAVVDATKTLTIDTGFSNAYPILSPIQITKANNNKWSSQGVTTLNGALDGSQTNVTVFNNRNIAVGNMIVVDSEEMAVTAKTDTTGLTVTRGDNAAAHVDGAVVGCIVKPAGLGKWTQVGGQGITVRFDYDGNDEKQIQSGDYVDFICYGLKLEQRKGSKIIIADRTSIAEHGKRKARSSIENRFLSAQLAEYKLTAIKDRYKNKKRVNEINMPMNLDYEPKDIFYLESTELYPDEVNNAIGVIVQVVTYDTRALITTYLSEEQ